MSNPTDRLRMASKILDFEARRDSRGRLKVYYLPAGDGGGTYEVAGINDRYHPTQARDLRRLVEAGRFDEAEDYAQRYIASYTDAGDRWTPHDAVESYLRDSIFNRGAGGAAKIYQMALGVRVDGDVGPITRAEGEEADPAELLPRLRASRERYEREVLGRDESSRFWAGLVNRWNKALRFAEEFLEARSAESSTDDPGEPGEYPAESPDGGPDTGGLGAEAELSEEAFARRESGDIDAEAEQAEAAGAPAPARAARAGSTPVRAAGDLNLRVLDRPLSTRARSGRPTLVVLHATAGASAMSSINHLRSVGLGYHYIIARDGRDSPRTRNADGSKPIIFHCVRDEHRVGHVGSTIPAPSGQSINESAIGISLANIQSGGEQYTEGQIEALNALLAHLKSTHPSLRHLTTHAVVQPWNRADPVRIDGPALARAHGFEFFKPTAQQIRAHRP
jgi:N-acetyl-anhydromuramyl-L-alanine amidase AmpD